jgi:hypothetical protein
MRGDSYAPRVLSLGLAWGWGDRLLQSSSWEWHFGQAHNVSVYYRTGDVGYHLIKSTRRNFMADLDSELLISLSLEELQALAEGLLAPTLQAQLEGLLAQGTEHPLSPDEEATLDRMLLQIDQLNILKTRAKYTLNHLSRASAAA